MPMLLENLPVLALLAFVAAVAVIDLATRRIPNALTVPAAALALITNFITGGPGGLLAACGGLLIGLAIFLPFYLMRGFGAGDVKAIAAVGAFLGPKGAALAAGFTLAFGGLAGVLLLAGAGGLTATMHRWWGSLALARFSGQFVPLRAESGDMAARRFPYGLAIAAGTIAAAWWLGLIQPLIEG